MVVNNSSAEDHLYVFDQSCAIGANSAIMRLFERKLQESDNGVYDWGCANNSLTAGTRQSVAVTLLTRYLECISGGTSTDAAAVAVFEGVDERCCLNLLGLSVPVPLLPGSPVSYQVNEVVSLGKGGTGGGRFVFASDRSMMAKQGPGAQLVKAKVQV